jgi:hypothetical protein
MSTLRGIARRIRAMIERIGSILCLSAVSGGRKRPVHRTVSDLRRLSTGQVQIDGLSGGQGNSAYSA